MFEYIAASKNDNRLSVNVLIFTSLVIAVPLVIIVVWLKADYNRHKKPLLEIDPNVKYTFWHHVKVVSIPLMSYRITFMIQKKNDSHEAHRSSNVESNTNSEGTHQTSNQQHSGEQHSEGGQNNNTQPTQNVGTTPLPSKIIEADLGSSITHGQSGGGGSSVSSSHDSASEPNPDGPLRG